MTCEEDIMFKLLKFITQSLDKVTSPIFGNFEEDLKLNEQQKKENKDKFFVGMNGSVSLNYENEEVQADFAKNVENLRNIPTIHNKEFN